MQYLVLGNPMWSGQLALQGGWRRLFWTSAFYALLLVVVCAVALKWQEFKTEREAAIWIIKTLPYVQILVLFASGMPARAKAMIRDHTTVMIESIRIAPMRATSVVAGYLFGPVIATLIAWLIGVVVGWVVINAYGLGGSGDWMFGNAVLLISVMTAWSLQVFLGVGPKKPNGAIIAAYVAFFFMGRINEALQCAPGTSLFLGLHPAVSSMGIMRGAYPAQNSLAIGLFASVVMTLFWFWAAVRRFRRPESSALSARGAVILIGLWAMCAGGSFLNKDVLHAGSRIIGEKTLPLMGMIVATLSMVAIGLPIAAAAQSFRSEVLQSREPMGRLKSKIWPSAIAALLIALMLMWVITYAYMNWNQKFNDLWLVLVASTLLYFGAFRCGAFRKGSTTSTWTKIIAYWVLPAIIAAVWMGVELSRDFAPQSTRMGVLFYLSPIGTLISTWWFPDSYFQIGIVVQLGIAIAVVVVGYWVERSFRRKREDRFELDAIGRDVPIVSDTDTHSVPSNNGDET